MRLSLSPSENHRNLLRQMVPQLRYGGQPFGPWRRKLRRKVAELIGLPQVERPAIKPRRLWERQHELGSIEKIAFRAEAYADVLAYFCVPHGLRPPYPVMICLQGHSTGMHVSIAAQLEDESQPLAVEGDRDFALGCMRHGFAALCIEQRAFGYRSEKVQRQRSPHGCHDAVMQALMMGRTLVGERVFDVDRGLDYLAAR